MLVLRKNRQAYYLALLVSVLLLTVSAHQLCATDAKPQPKSSVLLPGFPTVKQLPNYCGPAALSSVLLYWGKDIDQKKVAREVFDRRLQATNGADMLLYAREHGCSAYSWNSSIGDLKKKLAEGLPVIVLQDSTLLDNSGHFRVAIGYDDEKKIIRVMDPYYVKNDTISYRKFVALWRPHGNWSLVVVPPAKDHHKQDLGDQNPVVHIDLAYVYYRKGKLNEAAEEGQKALTLEPRNPDALSLVNRVKRDIQYAAGSKAAPTH